MAFLTFPNVQIVGISACVPKNVESNWDSDLIPDNERCLLIRFVHVSSRRID